ncbi:MAG: tryptophan 7-halogenase [Alphaproteobacteria bacterium]|nr:tryptophan 7-halogenase [Alphaproteobacteria bacterium]MDE2162632.1 tryptophan 7-halogenase [Alphaproteobacteria bacterium]MDE2265629.1 tryptophan 7-halogenase [Alphaproteobacteria bacterium]
MPDHRIRSVAVVGDGIAAWMAALAVARALGPHCSVRVITPGGGPRGLAILAAGEGTLPALRAFHRLIGIDEDDLVRRTGAGFKLGIRFFDWGRIGSSYFHPFSEFGATLDSVAFQHHWLRLRAEGQDTPLEAYSVAAMAAQSGRFARPLNDPRSVLSTYSYGLHLDGTRYAAYLREIAEKRGVAVSVHAVAGIDRGDDGQVQAVRLAGGEPIQADLFIDCSGAIVEGALKIGYEDWSRWLPCDRILGAMGAPDPLPYSEARAVAAGWHWRIPLQRGTGHGLVYASRHLSEDEARAELVMRVGEKSLGEPTQLRFVNGRRAQFWSDNVIALGDAAGFLEPLGATNLHLVQTGIVRLLALLPHRDRAGAERSEYNRQMTEEWQGVRDFLILHYKATQRDDTDFWKECRAMKVPETLAYKIRLFEARGRVVLYDEETFLEPDFMAVFIGQDVLPRRYDPVADTIELDLTKDRLNRMRATIRQAAETMPAYRAFIARYGTGQPTPPQA